VCAVRAMFKKVHYEECAESIWTDACSHGVRQSRARSVRAVLAMLKRARYEECEESIWTDACSQGVRQSLRSEECACSACDAYEDPL
jgi:hypothetical protein